MSLYRQTEKGSFDGDRNVVSGRLASLFPIPGAAVLKSGAVPAGRDRRSLINAEAIHQHRHAPWWK
jgi:hypothetical protein